MLEVPNAREARKEHWILEHALKVCFAFLFFLQIYQNMKLTNDNL